MLSHRPEEAWWNDVELVDNPLPSAPASVPTSASAPAPASAASTLTRRGTTTIEEFQAILDRLSAQADAARRARRAPDPPPPAPAPRQTVNAAPGLISAGLARFAALLVDITGNVSAWAEAGWNAVASIRWSVALAGLLVAIAALLAAVIFGAYTWVKADIAEKYFKADYNLNFYIFCEAPEHRQDPHCNATLSRGIGGLVVQKRDEPTSDFDIFRQMQNLSAGFEKDLSLSGASPRQKYADALAFRNVAFTGVLVALNQSASLLTSESDFAPAEAAPILASLRELRHASAVLYSMVVDDVRPPTYGHYAPLERIPVAEARMEMLYIQHRTLEQLRAYFLGVLRGSGPTQEVYCGIEECRAVHPAIRRYVVSEEVLARAGEPTCLPAYYRNSGWMVYGVDHMIEEVQSFISEQRGALSSLAVGKGYVLRLVRLLLVFEAGGWPVAHFVLADVYATLFTPNYETRQPYGTGHLVVLLLVVGVGIYAAARFGGLPRLDMEWTAPGLRLTASWPLLFTALHALKVLWLKLPWQFWPVILVSAQLWVLWPVYVGGSFGPDTQSILDTISTSLTRFFVSHIPCDKVYMASLPLFLVILYSLPRFRGGVSLWRVVRVLWPAAWFWVLSFLRYEKTERLWGKYFFATNAALGLYAVDPTGGITPPCKFWFQASELADVSPKIVLLVTLLDAWASDEGPGYGPGMNIADKIGHMLLLRGPFRSFLEPRLRRLPKRVLGLTVCGVAFVYAVWLHARIYWRLLPHSPSIVRFEDGSNPHIKPHDMRIGLNVMSIAVYLLYVGVRLERPRLGISLAIVMIWFRSEDYPLDNDAVKCRKRVMQPGIFPADAAADLPIVYYFFFLVALHYVRQGRRSGLKSS